MTGPRPEILIFCTGELEGGLQKIKEKANVFQASYNKPNACSNRLKAHPAARAIWIVDPEIATPKHKNLSDQVINWVRSGGTVILGGYFSSGVTPPDFDRWMEYDFAMPWRFGQYERTTVVLQDDAAGAMASWRTGLAASYSQKAVFLKNVAKTEAWYISPKGSQGESTVFNAIHGFENCLVVLETAVAFGKVGEGWLGWIGDVNHEEETAAVIRAMMELNN